MPRIGQWTFPGGYVDLGETPEQAAVRETAEEVGMNVRLGAMLGLFSDAANPIAAVAVYLAEPGSETPGLSAEATEVRYFAPVEIPWDELAFRTTEASLRAGSTMIERAVEAINPGGQRLHQLAIEGGGDRFDSVGLVRAFVGTHPDDARETQRHPTRIAADCAGYRCRRPRPRPPDARPRCRAPRRS